MWYAPDFLSNCSTYLPVAAPIQKKQEARVKGFAVERFRKRPEIDPSGRLRMAM